MNGAEFVTRWNMFSQVVTAPNLSRVFTSETAVLVHGNFDPAAGSLQEALQCADHGNRQRRGPAGKFAVLASGAANYFVTLFSSAASSVNQLRRTGSSKMPSCRCK